MSKKVEKASDELINLFELIKDKQTSIPEWVRFELRCSTEQKELYKIQKINEVVDSIYEEYAKDSLNFAIVINEDILDQLPHDLKEMALDECLTAISISENDKVSLKKPTVNTYFGVLSKYGNDNVIKLHESVKSLFDNKKQKEKEEKEASKPKSKDKRFGAHNSIK